MSEHDFEAELDEFEAQEMRGDSRVLLRDKLASRKMAGLFGAMTLLTAALALGVAAPSGDPGALVAFIAPVIMALSTLTMTVVRTLVTEDEVVVKLGLWGPRVKAAEIVSAEVIPYPFMKYGGWGIRRGIDGSWAYTMLGGTKRVLELKYRDGERVKTVVFSAENPEAVAAAIDCARDDATATPRVRVDSAPAHAVATEADTGELERGDTR